MNSIKTIPLQRVIRTNVLSVRGSTSPKTYTRYYPSRLHRASTKIDYTFATIAVGSVLTLPHLSSSRVSLRFSVHYSSIADEATPPYLESLGVFLRPCLKGACLLGDEPKHIMNRDHQWRIELIRPCGLTWLAGGKVPVRVHI